METSAASVTRQPRKGNSKGREDNDCIRFIEALPRLFSHKVEGDDNGKLHVGHVGRWLRAHGHRELAGRLRKATRIRNASAHPVDAKQLLDDLAGVASGEASKSTTDAEDCSVHGSDMQGKDSEESWGRLAPEEPSGSFGKDDLAELTGLTAQGRNWNLVRIARSNADKAAAAAKEAILQKERLEGQLDDARKAAEAANMAEKETEASLEHLRQKTPKRRVEPRQARQERQTWRQPGKHTSPRARRRS